MVTRAELSRVSVLGRPFKPLAVGLIVGGTTLSVNTILAFLGADPRIPVPDGGSAATHLASLLMGFFAGLGVFLMVFAWIIRSQRVYEWGLLLSFGGWNARWVGMALDGDAAYALLPFSFALMAGGAYILETMDAQHQTNERRTALLWRVTTR